MKATVVCLALAALVASVAAQPPGSNPGNCVSANPTGVIPQKIAVESYKYTENLYKWSDEDLLQFTLNGECLEANFDTCAAFGRPLTPDLEATADGSVSLGGCRKANLRDPLVQLWAEEVARNEAGHNRLLRERLRQLGQEPIPCPPVDIEGGFTTFINNAMNKTGDEVVPWDPYKSDLHFLISTATLEYVGATGDQGLVLFMKDKVNAALMGGLATSAYSHTAADHALLWRDINTEVPEFGVPVSYLFDAISKYRDSLDGVVNLDQGLVFAGGINLAPTDGNGAGLARLPQQVVNIFQCGQESSGCFFPEGFSGPVKTNKPVNIPTIPKEWIVAANTPPAVTFKVEPALQNTSAPWDGTSAFAIVGGPNATREVPDPAVNETLSGEQFSLVPSTEGMEDGGDQEGVETPDDGGMTPDDGGMTPDDGGMMPGDGGMVPDDGGMDMGGEDMSGSGVITIGPMHPGKIFLKKIGRKLRSVA